MAACFSLAVVVGLLKHPPAVQTPPWVLLGSSRSSSPEVWEVLMSFLAGLLLNGSLLLPFIIHPRTLVSPASFCWVCCFGSALKTSLSFVFPPTLSEMVLRRAV